MTLKNAIIAALGMVFGILIYQSVNTANACSCMLPAASLVVEFESVSGEGLTEQELEDMRQMYSRVTKINDTSSDQYNSDRLCLSNGEKK